MKTIFVTLSLITCLLSSAQHTDSTVVNRYLSAAFDSQWAAMMELMDDSIVDFHPTILMPPARGQNDLLEGWKSSVTPFEKLDYEILGQGNISLAGEVLSGQWFFDAREVRAVPSGGDTTIVWQMIGLYKVSEGLITEVRNYGNLLDIYLQMGYEVVPSTKND